MHSKQWHKPCRGTLRLALLNACEGAYASRTDIFASTAATLVQQGIPAVIAMQYEITDHAAIEFSTQFYDALTAGLPVDSAVTDARRAVSLAIHNTLEWGIPVLFMRSPDGVIFAFDERGVSRETRSESSPERVTLARDDQPISDPFPEAVADQPEQLTGAQIQALWQALLDGYTDSTLAQLVRFQLNERLDAIAGGENFADRVYHLIDWAERMGRMAELIAKAQAGNPGNERLRQVALEILGEAVEPPAVAVQTPSPATNQPATGRTVQPKPPSSPIAFEWCHVPAGDFLMGSDNHYDWEKPQHTVNLPAFYIAKTPVTNAQYKRFVDAKGYQAPEHWQKGQFPKGKEQHPVVNVSWRDAMAFCQWAAVGLPSEAQWEKAARGTDGWLYPWGNNPPTDKLCNFRDSKIGDTTPVGNYPNGASQYDCLDMAGNVWEWTSSLFKAYPYQANDGRENPDDSGRRTLRGGAFVLNVNDVRCAFRYDFVPDDWSGRVGFRVVSPGAVAL